MTGSEQVLIHDWCQQYMTHSIGDLAFGPGGALYVSGGEGAHPDRVDYGQGGGSPGSPVPKNPCGDPPGGVGATLSPPSARGGSLRSQSLRRPAGEPRVLNGTIARVNPATGAGLPNNPLASSANANERRIVAGGLRNPFRFALRPGTDELWIGDVGNVDWEEIDRVPAPLSAPVKNFGWPCYEGNGPQGSWQAAGLSICSSLYAQSGAVTAPFTTYFHASKVAGESCSVGSSSVTGVAFQPPGGGSYGSEYDGALFFADRSRRCIWAMLRGSSALPDRAWTQTFVAGAANPVDLQAGPGGDLYYADFDGGTVRRIRYTGTNRPPIAIAGATPTSGDAPLTVTFDATQSSDPDPNETLTYSWDLDGDGAFDDSALPRPTFTYTDPGTYTATLRVTDAREATSTDYGHDHGRQQPADRPHRGAHRRLHLGRGRSRRLPRLGDRPAGRHAARLGAVVGGRHAPLPVQLPYPPDRGLRGRGDRLVRRARPRLPLAPRAAPHGHRLRRPDRRRQRATSTPRRST